MWDLIANGIAIQQNKWLPANLGLINPIDWFLMATRKSTDGIYSHPTLIAGAPLTVNGLRLMPHPIINQDEYLLGDFTRAEIKFKKGLTVRWYDQDQDNAVKNLVTVVAEERAAFAVYYPDAFLKGDFGNIS
jgi:HK97 family phage major capsid protein